MIAPSRLPPFALLRDLLLTARDRSSEEIFHVQPHHQKFTMSAPSPLRSDSDLVSFALKSGGTAVQERYEVISLTVDLSLNRIPSATVVVRDGSAAQEDFAVSASKDFAPGSKIEILAGYHQSNQSLFAGIVVKSAIRVERCGDSTFSFTCRDAAVAMTIGRPSACFLNQKDSDVIATLIAQHGGLTATVSSTSETHEELTQYAASDWDFMLTRAEANGFVVQVSAGRVTVAAPALSAAPVLQVTYGVDVLAADLEVDASTQSSSVACSAWDPTTQSLLTATEKTKNINPLGGDRSAQLATVAGPTSTPFQTPAPLKTYTLKTWAEAHLLKAELAKIRGTVRFQGSALAVPGALITLAGFGPRFDGAAYVSGVSHEICAGEWTTTATIGLDPEWFATRPEVSAPRAATLLPAISGLHLGTVKKIDADPRREHRVQVEIPTFDQTGKSLWARLSSPYATNQAGAFFYPEVGDEVVLAFLDSDPRFPVILGSLHSSSRPPPFTADPKNTHKAIVTQAQLKVIFDDEKKILTLQTPAGNQVVFSDEAKSIKLTDQTGNTVELAEGGITLTSQKDITLTANGDIKVKAKAGNLALSAAQKTSLSALEVSLAAATALTATGTASATLNSSGQTTVKGGLVMIN